jgi:hypothetical protein
MCFCVRNPAGSCQTDCHSRFFQGTLTTLQLFGRNFTEWRLGVVCLKTGFCIGGLMRSFNFSPRKPFALFTAHITIIIPADDGSSKARGESRVIPN